MITISCNSEYSSKPKGYFKIPFPEHAYKQFDRADFPYSFEYPVYADIIQDTTFFDSSPENPYWINIDFKQYKATLFISYKEIGGKSLIKVRNSDGSYRDSFSINRFDRLVDDAFNLTAKNQIVAPSIRDSAFVNPNGISGVFFKVAGNAATARQFFMSDSTKHFLRGALYIEATPKADSLQPVVDFLTRDMQHVIQTLRWKP
jgi:gliding motility-associated lipoprotein GldD